MKCVRCGSEMSDDARNCLKCGAINYNNPLNVDYANKYGDKEEIKRADSYLYKRKNRFFPIILLAIMVMVIITIVLYFLKVI